MKLFIVTYFVSLSLYSHSQLSFLALYVDDFSTTEEEYISNTAYKIPFRGENYKFYGTLSYHVFGKAYAEWKVHNAIIESFKLSENNCSNVHFKILKSTSRSSGKLLPYVERKNGYNADFICPILKNDVPVKYYYRTRLLRFFIRYNSKGQSKRNKKIKIDFDAMTQYIINLDDASKLYGLRIKRVVFDRRLLKQLYNSKSGKELKKREIYFAKYLSKKVNRKYDDLFHVDFEKR